MVRRHRRRGFMIVSNPEEILKLNESCSPNPKSQTGPEARSALRTYPRPQAVDVKSVRFANDTANGADKRFEADRFRRIQITAGSAPLPDQRRLRGGPGVNMRRGRSVRESS